jgi:F-box domain
MPMLQDLPPDCLRLIVGYLPTASSIFNLALASRHFNSQISADNYAILRDFVQNAFPSVKTSPPWRDTAIKLTSRSRAWDRRAVIARECWNIWTNWKHLSSASKHGFVPVIDSYETTSSDALVERKEVLAHSAAGRVIVRINCEQGYKWKELKFPGDHQPENDILDLHLLKPHQQHASQEETIIFQRANGEVAKVKWQEEGSSEKTFAYIVPGRNVDCMTISYEKDPLLAVCNSKALHLYPVHRDDHEIEPTSSVNLQTPSAVQHKRRCARFLSENLLATGLQCLEGRNWGPIQIYDVNASPTLHGTLEPLLSLTASSENTRTRHGANVLAPLETLFGHGSSLFLSGWTDGIVRLYDTRAPQASVATYHDTVDDGQILSLLPIGQERFLAGSHQNACLKTFDLRFTGARPYSYRRAAQSLDRASTNNHRQNATTPIDNLIMNVQRDINIFIAPFVNIRPHSWFPVSRSQRYFQRYRGPVYSLSSPSSSSPTVYAGITNHVIQLDSVSSDDILKGTAVDPLLHLSPTPDKTVLDLSCYERPRPGHSSTDPILLRKQREWRDAVNSHNGKTEQGTDCPVRFASEEGWDERWWPPENRNNGRETRWVRDGNARDIGRVAPRPIDGGRSSAPSLVRPSRRRQSSSNAGGG